MVLIKVRQPQKKISKTIMICMLIRRGVPSCESQACVRVCVRVCVLVHSPPRVQVVQVECACVRACVGPCAGVQVTLPSPTSM